jgi:ABC-type transport system substrate-binding protein
MKGTTDFIGIPKDNFDAAINEKGELKPALSDKGIQLQKFLNQDVVFIAFNMDDPVLGKNANLRKALALAYDTKTASEKFYNNRVMTAHSPIAPDMEGFDPEFKNPYKEHNVEKAKDFLKKAGHPEGKGLPPLEYSISGSSTGRQMAEFTAQQFAKIGVKLNITTNSWPQFQERVRSRKAQMFGMAWGADYPDAENMLQLFYSKNASPGSNMSNYSNKEYDALYEKALKTPPGPERTALYKKMRDMFVRDMPWIPTVHRIGYLTYHGWVKNLKRHEMMQGNLYKYLRVDTAKKAELKAKL